MSLVKSILLSILALSLIGCGDDEPKPEPQNRYAESTLIASSIVTPYWVTKITDKIKRINLFPLLDDTSVIAIGNNTLHIYGSFYEGTNNVYVNLDKTLKRDEVAYPEWKTIETIIHELLHKQHAMQGVNTDNPTGRHSDEFYNEVNSLLDIYLDA